MNNKLNRKCFHAWAWLMNVVTIRWTPNDKSFKLWKFKRDIYLLY